MYSSLNIVFYNDCGYPNVAINMLLYNSFSLNDIAREESTLSR